MAVVGLLAALHSGSSDANAQLEIPELAGTSTPGYLSGELIYALQDRPTPQCHAPTIAATDDKLVAAWFGGTNEGHNDVGIWVSVHNGEQWAPPKLVVDGSEGETRDYACWNPVFYQQDEGPLFLFYKVGPSPALWWGMLITSDDAGKTWSKPRKLGESPALFAANRNLLGPVKNKPIMLSTGVLLCPSSTENDGWRVHFETTQDDGATWQVTGPIDQESSFNAIQPTILQHKSGRLQCLCRSQEGVIVETWSEDGGETWSPLAATALPNPNSGIDGVTLANGQQLLVYNHTTREGTFPRGRNMLNIAISTDGKNWKPAMTLERDRGEFSYPSAIQAADGKVHVVYTWKRVGIKHVVIDPARLFDESRQ